MTGYVYVRLYNDHMSNGQMTNKLGLKDLTLNYVEYSTKFRLGSIHQILIETNIHICSKP